MGENPDDFNLGELAARQKHLVSPGKSEFNKNPRKIKESFWALQKLFSR